jgi:hypothetical protein
MNQVHHLASALLTIVFAGVVWCWSLDIFTPERGRREFRSSLRIECLHPEQTSQNIHRWCFLM